MKRKICPPTSTSPRTEKKLRRRMHRLPRNMKQRERELTSDPDQARRVTCREWSVWARVGIQGGIQEGMRATRSEMLGVEALLDPSVCQRWSATASETPGLAAFSHIHGQEPSQGTQSLNKQLSGIVLSAKKMFPTCVNRQTWDTKLLWA